jgi:hypothetical protein
MINLLVSSTKKPYLSGRSYPTRPGCLGVAHTAVERPQVAHRRGTLGDLIDPRSRLAAAGTIHVRPPRAGRRYAPEDAVVTALTMRVATVDPGVLTVRVRGSVDAPIGVSPAVPPVRRAARPAHVIHLGVSATARSRQGMCLEEISLRVPPAHPREGQS